MYNKIIQQSRWIFYKVVIVCGKTIQYILSIVCGLFVIILFYQCKFIGLLLIPNKMWRPSSTIFRKVVVPSLKDKLHLSKIFYTTKSRLPRSTAKLTIVSASVGILIGAGYGGYTHYKINAKNSLAPTENEVYGVLKEAPKYRAHYKVSSILKLNLYKI